MARYRAGEERYMRRGWTATQRQAVLRRLRRRRREVRAGVRPAWRLGL